MVSGWFAYSCIATVLYGLVNFMYKAAAENNCSSAKTVNVSAVTISLVSLTVILITKSPFTDIKNIIFFAVINSTFFALGNMSKVTALKKADSAYVFPVTKLNAAFVIIISIVFFHNRPTLIQWIGIIISLSVVYFAGFSSKKSEQLNKSHFLGILFALLAAFCTSISMTTGKMASTSVPKLNYIFISYSMVGIYTFFINKYFSDIKNTKDTNNKVYLFGAVIGLLNFSGYYLVLKAFATGPMSLIQAVFSNSFIVPIILSVFIYHEKIDRKKIIIIFLALCALMCIKL